MKLEKGKWYEVTPCVWKYPYGTITGAQRILDNNPWRVYNIEAGSVVLATNHETFYRLLIEQLENNLVVRDPYNDMPVEVMVKPDYTVELFGFWKKKGILEEDQR